MIGWQISTSSTAVDTESALLKASALVVFLGMTVVFLFLILNFDSVPEGISIIVLLCALVMYKHVYDIVKSLRNVNSSNE